MTQTLHPVSRNIPIGKNMNPDSLSMKTEYACYPPSTTEVRIFVINHSQQKYTCGNDYSLAFYNGSKRQWETISANPTIEDIGWVLLPQYPLISRQSNSMLLKYPIVRENTEFIKHSIEMPKK